MTVKANTDFSRLKWQKITVPGVKICDGPPYMHVIRNNIKTSLKYLGVCSYWRSPYLKLNGVSNLVTKPMCYTGPRYSLRYHPTPPYFSKHLLVKPKLTKFTSNKHKWCLNPYSRRNMNIIQNYWHIYIWITSPPPPVIRVTIYYRQEMSSKS